MTTVRNIHTIITTEISRGQPRNIPIPIFTNIGFRRSTTDDATNVLESCKCPQLRQVKGDFSINTMNLITHLLIIREFDTFTSIIDSADIRKYIYGGVFI